MYRHSSHEAVRSQFARSCTLIGAAVLWLATGYSAYAQPLSESDLQTLFSAAIDDDTILQRIKRDGVIFKCEPSVLEGLKKSGASEKVLAGLRELPAKLTGIPYVAGWGTFVDPVGDCKYESNAKELVITVPGGAYHDLWPTKGKVNAPMVVQDVEGDFSFEVQVNDVTPAVSGSQLSEFAAKVAFHAGSIVVWQDDKNFVRFDRTEMTKDNQVIKSCYFHVFENGQRMAEESQLVEDRRTQLRLTRKANEFTASYSQDSGVSWKQIGSKESPLPRKVKIGAAVLNNTNLPCRVSFGKFTISQKK